LVVPAEKAGKEMSLSQEMGRAVAALNEGRLVEAERLCLAIVERNRVFVEAVHLLAVVQSLSGRLDEALASYDRALALRPGYAAAWCDRGVTLNRACRFDAALASYDKAIALRSDYAEVFFNRGIVLSKLSRLDEAVVSYERAIALKPDYAEAFNNRGNALAKQKRFDKRSQAMNGRLRYGRTLPTPSTITAPCSGNSSAWRRRSKVTARRSRLSRTLPKPSIIAPMR
jgi:tetratricopeptide (TPR) repeat protein